MGTHTIAALHVSRAAYDEVAKLLRAAGYDHAFGVDGTIDMTGIGLTADPPLHTPHPAILPDATGPLAGATKRKPSSPAEWSLGSPYELP